MSAAPPEQALVLSGGGARCAYQAGFLAALAERRPDFRPRILTGVSAGGINATFLAAEPGPFAERAAGLERLWERIRTEDVFDVGVTSLLPLVARWGLRLVTGRAGRALGLRGLVDTAPLRRFLAGELHHEDGVLTGIERHLDEGGLAAIALTAASYATGRSVTWIQGRQLTDWARAHRVSVPTRLRLDHVLASSALPLFFPAVEVDGQWYGDGGIRLTAPLSPAIHLGADKVLALAIRAERKGEPEPATHGYPPPAQILGNLLNAVFLDQFDADALRLERINQLVRALPADARQGLRPVELLVLRPSQDLGRLANECEAELPHALRFLTRGLGTSETSSNDLLSLVMFQADYTARLLELGRNDAAAQAARIDAFLGPPR